MKLHSFQRIAAHISRDTKHSIPVWASVFLLGVLSLSCNNEDVADLRSGVQSQGAIVGHGAEAATRSAQLTNRTPAQLSAESEIKTLDIRRRRYGYQPITDDMLQGRCPLLVLCMYTLGHSQMCEDSYEDAVPPFSAVKVLNISSCSKDGLNDAIAKLYESVSDECKSKSPLIISSHGTARQQDGVIADFTLECFDGYAPNPDDGVKLDDLADISSKTPNSNPIIFDTCYSGICARNLPGNIFSPCDDTPSGRQFCGSGLRRSYWEHCQADLNRDGRVTMGEFSDWYEEDRKLLPKSFPYIPTPVMGGDPNRVLYECGGEIPPATGGSGDGGRPSLPTDRVSPPPVDSGSAPGNSDRPVVGRKPDAVPPVLPTAPNAVPPQVSVLDCNRDYTSIRTTKISGICLNSSSGNCYAYANGDVLYDQGSVPCP